jgi:hypothetical protein
MVVGGRRRSRRSVAMVWGVSGAKCGCLRSVALRGNGRGCHCRWLGASSVRSVAAVVEGGGGRGCWPCWGREKRRKKREEEKILGGGGKNKPFRFFFYLFIFLKSITMVHIIRIGSCHLGFYGSNMGV